MHSGAQRFNLFIRQGDKQSSCASNDMEGTRHLKNPYTLCTVYANEDISRKEGQFQ
jgi:hypothetical protein